MKTVYLIQTNMADPDQNPEWAPVQAHETRKDAEAQVDRLNNEYGENIEYRIEALEFFPDDMKAAEQSWRNNPDRMGGQFTQDEIDNHGRWI